jgi:predicted enzyme related to lactoylglutathione lyase
MTTVAALPANRPIWFDLMSKDIASTRPFYKALFGWSYDVSGPEMGHYSIAKASDDRIAAGIGQIPEGQEMPPSWTVYFGTEDADATCAKIAEHGGTVMMPPMDVAENGRMAMCTDPTGAVFGLWQPGTHVGANVVEEHGAMAWCEVNTRDHAAASRFYADVFGLTPKASDEMDAPYSFLLQGDEMVCGVMQMGDTFPADVPAHWLTYFQVDDLDAALGTVKGNGGQVAHGPFPTPYGRMVVVTDPDNAVFSIIQPPAE